MLLLRVRGTRGYALEDVLVGLVVSELMPENFSYSSGKTG